MKTTAKTPRPFVNFLQATALALVLLPTTSLAEESELEVPSWTANYRDSVRCMPEIRSAGSLRFIPGNPAEMSLEEQDANIRLIPLRTSIDGDLDPDVLMFGADTYQESVACTARHYDTLISYGVSVQWMPKSSLETQEDLPQEELPAVPNPAQIGS